VKLCARGYLCRELLGRLVCHTLALARFLGGLFLYFSRFPERFLKHFLFFLVSFFSVEYFPHNRYYATSLTSANPSSTSRVRVLYFFLPEASWYTFGFSARRSACPRRDRCSTCGNFGSFHIQEVEQFFIFGI
jgi:hypothetical protein